VAGRKPKYDQLLMSLKKGKHIDNINGIKITEHQEQAIRKRAKVLGIGIEFRTINGVKTLIRKV
jgi:LDH2 family malate/lactate/ureidoglycolate dehydrogenase